MQEDNSDLARILELEKSPCINTLRYEHFGEIQLQLQLISTSYCFILDHRVGEKVVLVLVEVVLIHFQVEQGLAHGFQAFRFISVVYRRASANCVITLKRLRSEVAN